MMTFRGIGWSVAANSH